MRVCDICTDPTHQPVLRASIHVKGKSGGALDMCEACLDRAAANRNPAKARATRLTPYVPRELTDSAALASEEARGVNSQAGWITPSGPLDKDPI